jgi:hypothetical protein
MSAVTDSLSRQPNLASSPKALWEYASQGDVTKADRANLQEALMVMQLQTLIQQNKAAKAQVWATIGTFLLFVATVGLIIATA